MLDELIPAVVVRVARSKGGHKDGNTTILKGPAHFAEVRLVHTMEADGIMIRYTLEDTSYSLSKLLDGCSKLVSR